MSHQKEFVKESQIFSQLSNPTRLQILNILNEKRMTLSQIAKKLNTSIQALQNHAHKLTSSKLIEKNSDGFFSLTALAEISLIQIPSLQFLYNNIDFFQDHNLGDTPTELFTRIGELYRSKLNYGISANLKAVKNVIEGAHDYLDLILTSPPIMVGELLKKQLDQGIKINLILGKNSILPDDSEFVKSLKLKTKTVSENLQKRMVESVSVNLIISEKQSLLIFPHDDFSTDMHNSFTSKNSFFNKWCSDFFKFKWEQGENFARLR